MRAGGSSQALGEDHVPSGGPGGGDGAEEDRVLAQRAGHDPGPQRGEPAQGVADRVEQQVGAVADAAAEYDEIGVQDGGDRGHGVREPLALLADRGDRGGEPERAASKTDLAVSVPVMPSARAARTTASAETVSSRVPGSRPGQGRKPISPAAPFAPVKGRPSATMPMPRPVPIIT